MLRELPEGSPMNASYVTTSSGSKAHLLDETKASLRIKTIATRLTPDELVEVESAAEEAGKPLAEWLRATALSAARLRPADPVELLLAEVWAIRYALLSLFQAGAQATTLGKPLLPESVLKIRDKTDGQKFEQARRLLADFLARPNEDRGEGR